MPTTPDIYPNPLEDSFDEEPSPQDDSSVDFLHTPREVRDCNAVANAYFGHLSSQRESRTL